MPPSQSGQSDGTVDIVLQGEGLIVADTGLQDQLWHDAYPHATLHQGDDGALQGDIVLVAGLQLVLC